MNPLFKRALHDFALTVSNYGALSTGGSDFMRFKQWAREDLRDLKRAGFDGIEGPWLNVEWNGGPEFRLFAPDREGLDRGALERLEWLIQEARALDLYVCPRISVGEGSGRFRELKENTRLVAQELVHYRNVLMDVGNEWNGRRPVMEVLGLLHIFRQTAPTIPRTASTAGMPVGVQHAALWEMWQIAHRFGWQDPVTFFAPHFYRGRGWGNQEEASTREYTRRTEIPVYNQEPHRVGYPYDNHPNPEAEEFVIAAQGARKAGSVGFCLHNGHFDLREKRLAEQMTSVEREAGAAMREAVGG